MSLTMPEGITPPPMMVDPRAMETVHSIGSSSFLAVISIILGIVIATGSVIGVVGKAFYVERAEYNTAVVATVEEKTKVNENIRQMKDTLMRQEVVLQKLTDDLALIKQDLAAMRHGRR
jgi:hypothetical protein